MMTRMEELSRATTCGRFLMALPQRRPSWHQHDLGGDLCTHDEPLISVGTPELVGVPQPEDSEPWCVDQGDGIHVMSTSGLRAALAAGELSSATKVWRDGNGFWLPIAEQAELVGDLGFECEGRQSSPHPDEETWDTAPEPSRIRRRQGGGLSTAWDSDDRDGACQGARGAAPLIKAAVVALALMLLSGVGYVAARMVPAPTVRRPPLRSVAVSLDVRLDHRELTVRLQPFPSWHPGSRRLCTFAVPNGLSRGQVPSR
jgi:hypothetical protein